MLARFVLVSVTNQRRLSAGSITSSISVSMATLTAEPHRALDVHAAELAGRPRHTELRCLEGTAGHGLRAQAVRLAEDDGAERDGHVGAGDETRRPARSQLQHGVGVERKAMQSGHDTPMPSVSPGRPPPPSAKHTTGSRRRAASSKSRSIFWWPSNPWVPERTVASYEHTTTGFPSIRPTPPMNPSAVVRSMSSSSDRRRRCGGRARRGSGRLPPRLPARR